MDYYDKLIKETIDDYADDIPCPSADDMFVKISKEVNGKYSEFNTRNFKYKKYLAAAVIGFVLVGSSIMLTTNEASAVKERVLSLVTNNSQESSKLTYKQKGKLKTPPPTNNSDKIIIHPDTFKEAQQMTCYTLLEPSYLPAEYKKMGYKLSGDKQQYSYFTAKYEKEDHLIKFTQHYRADESAQKVHFSEDDTTVKKLIISDKEVSLIVFNKNKSVLLTWQDHNFSYSLMCPEGEDEALKIVHSMYE